MNKKCLNKKINEFKKDYQDLKDTLLAIDPDIDLYVYRNLYEPDKHGTYEILSVGRFLSFFYKYNFSTTSYKRFVKFAESVAIKSEKGMMTFKLEPFQKFLMCNIWGWKNDDNTRVIRDALLYVPRKASKTTLIAQLAIYDLLFGPPDSQCYIASNSFNQAQVCFNIISASIKNLDPQMRSFHRTREKIYSVVNGRDSYIQCLSSSPDRLDGLSANIAIFDEYSQADSAELRNVLTSSQGTRENPLAITITTASTKLDSPFVTMLNNDKKILEGSIENDSIFAVIFEAEDNDDISSPDVWHKVQPMLGVSVKERFYEEEYKKAIISAEDMITFKTKLLNIFTLPTVNQWIKPSMIKRNQKSFKLETLTGKPICFVSYDLSVSDDMSAVSWACYDSLNHSFAFYNKFYLPKQTIENHPNKELYSKWVGDGFLTICGDEVIDYSQIANDIYKSAQYVNIVQVGYDVYKNRDLTNTLRAYGFKNLKPYRQTLAEFTSPCEALEIGLSENKIIIDDNPIINWMFGNAVIETDNIGNRKPVKISQTKKIDCVITMLMCLGQAMSFKR